jgi:hypothetical protein
MTIPGTIWEVVNTPAGITVVAGILLWIINRARAVLPKWAAFEGTIIAAVKYAEKKIPDNAPNKSAAKLDMALKYVLEVYKMVRGRSPSKKMEAELVQGIQIIHDRVEGAGNLMGKTVDKKVLKK